MQTIKKYIIILTLLSTILTNCSDGCLRCGPTKKCLFCDFQIGYHLKDGKCEKTDTSNCTNFSLNGNCSLCNEDYYVDSSTKKCVKVETLIENCKFYDSANGCSICKDKHFVLNGKCLKLDVEIKNCSLYFDKERCLECITNYELESDLKRCEKSPETRNCSIFSNLNCKSCSNGFIENTNYYLDVFFSFQISDSVSVVNYVNSTKNGRGDAIAPNKCQEIKNKNCLDSETANTCKTCQKGFYLNEEKVCIKNPESQIDNCELYETKTTCKKCLANFYLKTPSLCEQIITIENCLFYSETEQSTCLECIQNYFLQTNKCNIRLKTIEQCEKYNVTSDTCQSCLGDNVLTTDNLKCFTPIPNCISYSSNTQSDTTFTCNDCGDFFYLDVTNNTCLNGTVENCQVYGNSATTCVRCKNTFYLENALCVLHKGITSCSTYDFIQKDVCSSCDANHILFSVKNGCKAVTPIDKCMSYDSSVTCSYCEDGYVLGNSNSTCDVILAEENCLQKNSSNGCVKCKEGFFISGLVCKTYKDYQKENCVLIANDGTNLNDLNCEKCLPYFYAHNYEETYVCVSEQRLIDDSIKIENCIKHKTISATTKCEECKTGYFRNNSGSCELCASGLKIDYGYVLANSSGTGTVTDIIKNKCLPAATDCATKSFSVFGNDTHCLTCNVGKAPVTSSHKTLVNPDIAWNTTEKSLGSTWFLKTCDTPTGTPIYYPGGAQPDPNCELYTKVEIIEDAIGNPTHSHYFCNKCVFRKTGNIAEVTINTVDGSNASTTMKKTYLNCKMEVIGCENDYYGGFHFSSNTLSHSIDSLKEFTCHNCADQNQVIFAYLNMDSTATENTFNSELVAFGTDENAMKAKDSINKNGNVVSCRDVSAAGLGFKAENFTATFTENCQFAYFDVNKTKEFKTTTPVVDLPIKCVECKPGFRKVLDGNNHNILGCNPIENCDNNFHEKWINSCSSCLEGFSWKWNDTDKKILYDVCISNNEQEGCLAYSTSFVAGTTQNCKYCKKGYIFNSDGLCEKITAPKCDLGYYVNMDLTFKLTTTSEYNELYVMEYLLANGIGCTKCNDSYFPHLQTSISPLACTKSPYLESRDLIASTNYVKYCEDFSGNSNKCLKCFDNYLPTLNGLTCLPIENFNNCSIVNNNKNECHTCEPTSYLRKKNCELRLIPNCQDYQGNSLDMRCETCIPGYYTSSDSSSCVLGKLSNCVLYDNNGKCTQCGEKFGLVNLSDNKVYCLGLSEDLFCKQANSSKLSNHEFECQSCMENFVITTDFNEHEKTDCLKISEIVNCANHNINNNLISSTLRCDKCVDNFFITEDGLECKQRSNTITNCLTHSNTSETCDECQINFYKSNGNLECIPFPSGIKFCKEYLSETQCLKCQNGYFIQGSICEKLADDKIIVNCIEYEVNDTTVSCSRCDTNFIKTETGACEKPIARNCSTYKNLKECETCPEGYVFTTEADVTVTECIIKTILNCQNIDASTKKCLKCNPGYYINSSSNCSAVPIDITGCINYENKDNCSKCEQGRVLSKDKRECFLKGINNTNPMNNCEEIVYETDLSCVTCKEGFFFKNGECEKCVTSLEQGCYACDYNDSSKCLMCISGFHQEEEKKQCVRNNVSNGDGDNGSGDNGSGSSYGDVVKGFLAVFVIAFV